MANDTNRITLGSGKLYIKEHTSTDTFTDIKAKITEMQVDTNLIGYISGGASLDYKATFYTADDDFAYVVKTVLTKEEVTLKSGVMTWNGNTLKKLCSTATVTDDTVNGLRSVKIGGINNQDGKLYTILFVHEDAVDGNIYIFIVGNNQSGFTFSFATGKETVIDAEFKASPLDTDGTKIIYAEDIPKA
jgi:hypothetical protein